MSLLVLRMMTHHEEGPTTFLDPTAKTSPLVCQGQSLSLKWDWVAPVTLGTLDECWVPVEETSWGDAIVFASCSCWLPLEESCLSYVCFVLAAATD
jgi:hypothetical protein